MFRKAMTIEGCLKFDTTAEDEHLSATMTEVEFENFYNEHSRPLWSYAHRLDGGAEIADDIVQESFMRFLGVPQRADLNAKAYLYRIATNLVYDYFRRNSREIKTQNMAGKESFYEPFAAGDEMSRVFGKLNLQERALLWLAYVEGISTKKLPRCSVLNL